MIPFDDCSILSISFYSSFPSPFSVVVKIATLAIALFPSHFVARIEMVPTNLIGQCSALDVQKPFIAMLLSLCWILTRRPSMELYYSEAMRSFWPPVHV